MFGEVFRDRRVLLTGHTGFKGSWLALWLHDLGAHVVGLALPPESSPSHFELLSLESLIDHNIGDIGDLSTVQQVIERACPEIVIHMAAQALVRDSYDNPLETVRTNVLGTTNLLEAIRRADSVRAALLVSSDKCYRNREWSWGYREHDRLGGNDPYSASKAAAEIVCWGYVKSYFDDSGRGPHVGVATARAGNVVGGGDWARDRLIPDCIRAVEQGTAVRLRNPHAVRPWQHVLEALSGYLHLLAQLLLSPARFKGAWNFGPLATDVLTVSEATRVFLERFGRGSLQLGLPDASRHESSRLQLAIDKAVCELGWRPTLGVTEALQWAAEWYRQALSDPSATRDLSRRQIEAYCRHARRAGLPWARS